jgi:hypothetical protein
VVTCAAPDAQPHSHESVTRDAIARRIASLKDAAFGGEFDPAAHYDGPLYFVPADTVVGRARAAALGIRDAGDLFGAVVPHPFAATKSITHPLPDDAIRTPAGWRPGFADAVRGCVLDGFTAFDRDDARRAGRRQLARGAVRVKRATGIGGGGQQVVDDVDALDATLDELDAHELACYGCVLEENLADVVTYSVGRVEVAGLVATYCGTQTLTPNNHGASVYGGSDLLVARGEFEALLGLDLPAPARQAIAFARCYDRAADVHFDGFVASRRNYDVARGLDHQAVLRTGVLEQSWRAGGASGAEIGALEAFKADPSLRVVRASCTERYGSREPIPTGATVYFDDTDERVGRLTKYASVTHADA